MVYTAVLAAHWSPWTLVVLLIQALLFRCREQQQAKSKSGSPLSKWRLTSNAAKPAAGTAVAVAGAAATGGSSSNGTATAGGDGSGFSPMTRQLPAARANTTGAHWSAEDDVAGQVGVSCVAPPGLGRVPCW